MVFLSTAVLLMFGYVAAQDPDCDFRQNVGATDQFYISSPRYPYNYTAGRTCRYVTICPVGYNCRIDCNLNMPTSPNCSGDRLLLSRRGDPTLTGAPAYCGTRTLTVVSEETTLSMGLIVSPKSLGGRFTCNLTAQRAPVTPAPACRCGQKKETRIVGGNVTRPNEYPMMAGIIERSTNDIHCGGVIISDRYIMTAAHCVYNFRSPNELIVIVGTHYIDSKNRTGAYYDISRFIIHQQFNINTYDFDISLLQTTAQIQYTMTVQPVCLPFKYFSNPDMTGKNVTLLGWGTTSFGGQLSDALRQVVVTVTSQQVCRRAYANVSDRQFCTFARGKDACQMDSGGPVLRVDPSTGMLMSVGVISSGDGCGSLTPGSQTNVITLLGWVRDNANSEFCIIR